MFGVFALFTDRFMVSVRYLGAMGLDGVIGLALFYLGPAPYFFVSLMAVFSVLLHLNVLASVSSAFIVLNVFLFCFSFFSWGVECIVV